jgi:hypothetical protein
MKSSVRLPHAPSVATAQADTAKAAKERARRARTRAVYRDSIRWHALIRAVRSCIMLRFAAGSSLAAVLLVFCAAGGCGGNLDTGNSGGNTDGGLRDGSHVGHKDAGPFDATDEDGDDGADGDDGGDGSPGCNTGVCPSPDDVTGFQPTWKPPTGGHQNKCSAALIDEFYTDCLDTNGSQQCSTFGANGDAAHQACAACLQSQYTDASWGPLVYSPGEVETNESGCIALLDPAAMSCAQSVQADDECQHAACDPVCGIGDDQSFDGYVTCTAAANSCGCEPFFQAAMCAKMLGYAQSPAAPCLVGQTFQDVYYQIAAAFCGM